MFIFSGAGTQRKIPSDLRQTRGTGFRVGSIGIRGGSVSYPPGNSLKNTRQAKHVVGKIPVQVRHAGTPRACTVEQQRVIARRNSEGLQVQSAERSALTPAGKDVPDGWGKVLISASDAGERSWESDQLRNSVFTRFLIDGLRANRGAVEEAFDYSKPKVKQQVKLEKGAEVEQNPQLTPNRTNWNMSLAVPLR